MATLSSKPVNPQALNPYRTRERPEYTIAQLESTYRVRKNARNHIEDNITMDQVRQ
jgi:hypothetical protein